MSTEPSLKLAVYGVVEAVRLGLLPANQGVQVLLRVRRALDGQLKLKDKTEDGAIHDMAYAAVNMHHDGGHRPDYVRKAERTKKNLQYFMQHGVWPGQPKT